MTWSQVNTLINSGMTIGSHGYSHTSLSYLDKENLFNEINYSKFIEENTNTLQLFFYHMEVKMIIT